MNITIIEPGLLIALLSVVVGIIALGHKFIHNSPKISMNVSEETDSNGTYLLYKIENSRSKITIKDGGILLPNGEKINGTRIRGSSKGEYKFPISLYEESPELFIYIYPQDLMPKLNEYGYIQGKICVSGYIEVSGSKIKKSKRFELDINEWKTIPVYNRFLIRGMNRNW